MKNDLFNQVKTITLTIFLLAMSGLIYADKVIPSANNNEFDPTQANHLLDKLTLKLSIQDLSAQNLAEAVNDLTSYQTQAQKCIADKNTELADINKQLTAIGVSGQESKDLTKDQEYLVSKRDLLSQQLAECRLYTIRSQEAISAFSHTITKLTANELLSARPPIWENFKASSKILLAMPSLQLKGLVDTDNGLRYFNTIAYTLLGLLLCLALAVGIKFYQLAKRRVKKLVTTSVTTLKLTFYCILQRYAMWFTLAFSFALFASLLALITQDITAITRMSYGFLLLLIFLAAASFFFYPPKPSEAFNPLPLPVSRKLRFRLTLLAWWSFIGFTIYVLLHSQALPAELVYLSRSVFVILSAINLISVIWLTTQAIRWFRTHWLARILFNTLLSISLSITLIAEIFGYFNLSNYILSGAALTLAYSFIGWILFKSIKTLLENSAYQSANWQQVLYRHLGLSKKDSLPELWCLKIGLNALLGTALLALLVKVWGLSENSFKLTVQMLVHGFTLGSLHITPLRIILGLLVFAFLSLSVRMLRQRLLNQRMPQQEQEPHEALAVILGYIGFGLSFLFAVLIAGINLTGFAVIAGALSVGIGFGLQNIVNNFVSGIILLIERPIKPGDRIIVGQTEGYVKKISVRSTRITTPEKADVIVPNSELISAQVTNLMFQDHEYRIKIALGVSYDCDTELVEKLLIEIASAHPRVVNEKDVSPIVYFKQFANSTLNFELSCVINDVNQRGKTISELNFSINKTFREFKIDIPYPQQDIHIKSWPEKTNLKAIKEVQ
ncbi:MAG: mechanosensitive ion channel [Gammaproteobacteria bacterium]|nr:mechanosensitive ion channel [Gammaproteobacteria bacterium]